MLSTDNSRYKDANRLEPRSGPSGGFWRPLMTFANNLDPDEAPQNVGLHLRSKLFDIKIIYQQKNIMGGNNEFFENFERNKYLKKLPSMQRVNPFYLGFWCISTFVFLQTGWSQNQVPCAWNQIQYVYLQQYIEDLSWVVSWDQQFLNEFNKVLFSEHLASEITLFERV